MSERHPQATGHAETRPQQPLLSRRHMLIGGALAAASGVAYANMPEPNAEPVEPDEFEDMVPGTFDGYEVISTSGVVLPPPDTLRDRLYDNLSTRVYSAGDDIPVMLLLAYNNTQDGVLQVHRPEVCYPVGGYDLSETREVPFAALDREVPANFFTASGPNRVEQVAYFTRLGDAYPRSWAEQRLSVIRANLAGNIPDGMLMRVSMLSRDSEMSLDRLSAFATRFITASPVALQKLLLV